MLWEAGARSPSVLPSSLIPYFSGVPDVEKKQMSVRPLPCEIAVKNITIGLSSLGGPRECLFVLWSQQMKLCQLLDFSVGWSLKSSVNHKSACSQTDHMLRCVCVDAGCSGCKWGVMVCARPLQQPIRQINELCVMYTRTHTACSLNALHPSLSQALNSLHQEV